MFLQAVRRQALLLQGTVVVDRRRYNDAVGALNVELSMGDSMHLRRHDFIDL